METPQQLPAIGAVVIDTGSKPIKQGTVRKPSSSCFQRSPKCIFSPYIKSRPNPILFGPPWLSSSPHLLTHSGPLAFIAVAFSHAQPRRAHVSYCCRGRGKSLPCPPPSPQPSSPSLADRCCLLPRNSDYVLFGGAEERTEHSWGSFRTTLLNCYACTQCYRK